MQIAIDDAHKLIVAGEVIDDGNDSRQLHAMALAAKRVLGGECRRHPLTTTRHAAEAPIGCDIPAIHPKLSTVV